MVTTRSKSPRAEGMDIYDDVDVFDTPRGVQEIPIKADDVDDAKLKSFVAANQTMLKRLMEVSAVRVENLTIIFLSLSNCSD